MARQKSWRRVRKSKSPPGGFQETGVGRYSVVMHKPIVTHDGRIFEKVASQGSGPLRLLVVDDNETNRRLMSALLAPLGALVTFAFDGVEAVKAAAESSFDLILMDIQMPNMGGLEATRRIRESEASRSAGRTPIFAVTASAMQHQDHEYGAAGVDRVIPKPIDAGTLLAAIADVAAYAIHSGR